MSIIATIVDNDRVVVGTDSRFVSEDFAGIATDAAEKIFQVAPGVVLAPTGWKLVCDFQVEAARRIAQANSDIRQVADELDTQRFRSSRNWFGRSQRFRIRRLR